MTTYIFDIDGTLTNHRQPILSQHEAILSEFMETHQVVFVTGSDRPKAVEQLGEEIINKADMAFFCGGNIGMQGNHVFHQTELSLNADQELFIQDYLDNSQYPNRVGNHVEHRDGLVNFSIVGRNACPTIREHYYEWDDATGERQRFCQQFNAAFPELEAIVGGKISVDIINHGMDKRQVLAYTVDDTVFFGDSIYNGGNDLTIAMECTEYHKIVNYTETYEILKGL